MTQQNYPSTDISQKSDGDKKSSLRFRKDILAPLIVFLLSSAIGYVLYERTSFVQKVNDQESIINKIKEDHKKEIEDHKKEIKDLEKSIDILKKEHYNEIKTFVQRLDNLKERSDGKVEILEQRLNFTKEVLNETHRYIERMKE